MAQVLCAGVQLAVGKRAGAAFAELHIGLKIQRSAAPEPLHILSALLYASAALEQDGPSAAAGQHQGGK